jgi:hypothetical protein
MTTRKFGPLKAQDTVLLISRVRVNQLQQLGILPVRQPPKEAKIPALNQI